MLWIGAIRMAYCLHAVLRKQPHLKPGLPEGVERTEQLWLGPLQVTAGARTGTKPSRLSGIREISAVMGQVDIAWYVIKSLEKLDWRRTSAHTKPES